MLLKVLICLMLVSLTYAQDQNVDLDYVINEIAKYHQAGTRHNYDSLIFRDNEDYFESSLNSSVSGNVNIVTRFHRHEKSIVKEIIVNLNGKAQTIISRLESPQQSFSQQNISFKGIHYKVFYNDTDIITYSQSRDIETIELKEWIYASKPNTVQGSRYYWHFDLDDDQIKVDQIRNIVQLDHVPALRMQPIIYWTAKGVKKEGKYYLLENNRLLIEVKEPMDSYPLIIDPSITWGQWAGGPGYEIVHTMVASGDEIYLGGYTNSSTNWESTNVQGTQVSNEGFVLEIVDGATPSLSWVQYIGSSDPDEIFGLAVNGDEIYAAGYLNTTIGIESVTFQGARTGGVGQFESFLVEIADGGTPSLVWGQYLGGDASDYIRDVAVNGEEIYVAGDTASSVTSSWETLTWQGSSVNMEGYVIEIADGGTPSLVWGQMLGGSGVDAIYTIEVLSDEIYVGGYSSQTTSFESVTFQGTYNSASEVFVVEIADGGTPLLVWGQWLGQFANASNSVMALTVDVDNIYVGGSSSTSSSWTGVTFQGSFGSNADEAFIVKIADGGTPSVKWGQWFGGTVNTTSGAEEINTIAVNGDYIYAAGYVAATTGIESFTTYGAHSGGLWEGFLIRMIDGGNYPIISWGQYLGGTDMDKIRGVALSGTEIYVGGYVTNSASLESMTLYGTALEMEAFLAELEDEFSDVVGYFTGFEDGSLSTMVTPGYGAISSSVYRSGAYSAYFAENNNASTATFTSTLAAGAVYVRFGLYPQFVSTPAFVTFSHVINISNAGGGLGAALYINTDNSMQLKLRVNGIAYGSGCTLTTDTWHLVEAYFASGSFASESELKVDGAVCGSTSGDDIPGLVTTLSVSGTTANASFYIDDLIVRYDQYPGNGRIIARQGEAGSPTYNAWTKTSGQAINAVWSETPFSITNQAYSVGANEDQTMLVAPFTSGTNAMDSNDTINVCKVATVAKRGTGSATTNSLRYIYNGVNYDKELSLTTSDAYFESANFIPTTVTLLNDMEIGGTHGNSAGYDFTIQDIWLMCDYTAVANPSSTGNSNTFLLFY